MSYITASDIKAQVINGVTLNEYLDECDSEINDLAEQKGVRDTTLIVTDPLHFKIKMYAIYYVCMRVCEDKLGTNSNDVALEKYDRLYELYSKNLEDLYPKITYQMFTGDVDSMIDRACVYEVYRG